MSESALLDAIRAAPRDRVAREVYADWLEDRGDRRATCLRAHLAVIEVTPDHPVRWDREEVLGRTRLGLDAEWLAIVDPRPPLARSCDCFAVDGRSKKGNPRWRNSPIHDDIQDTTSGCVEVGLRSDRDRHREGADRARLPRRPGRDAAAFDRPVDDAAPTIPGRLYIGGASRARSSAGAHQARAVHLVQPALLPIRAPRAPQLRLSTVSTRALYGNVKFRPPFPLLAPRDEPMPPRPCSMCDAMFEDRGRHRYWTSRRVASDVMPLLINACSAACLANALPPSEGYVAKPHRGGPNLQQPPARSI